MLSPSQKPAAVGTVTLSMLIFAVLASAIALGQYKAIALAPQDQLVAIGHAK
ncbi:MAG: hypothetical protein HY369_01475 [Candidatus Aenigmarchaeota archaeon]|nr:hypothetical protein [Candidatus Aenigmarchaeota archaeon]